MEQPGWPRAVLAGAVGTAAFAAWRWAFEPVPGEGTYLPWTVLGLVIAATAIGTDRATRPFVGVATTAAAAGLADLLTGGRPGLDPSRLPDALYAALYVTLAGGALAAAVSGLHLVFRALPRARRGRAGVVVALGGAAWTAWMGWWPVDDSGPVHPAALTTAAACTVLIATVVGEVTLGSWRGAVLAVAPAALLSAAPLAAADSLGTVVWFMLTLAAAVVSLAGVGVVAACRGTRRRLRTVPR